MPTVPPPDPRVHQLAMLPPLAEESHWNQNTVVILVMVLCVTGLAGLLIGGLMKLDVLAITAFLSMVGGVGVTAVGLVGGNSAMRKAIYGIAASRPITAAQDMPEMPQMPPMGLAHKPQPTAAGTPPLTKV